MSGKLVALFLSTVLGGVSIDYLPGVDAGTVSPKAQTVSTVVTANREKLKSATLRMFEMMSQEMGRTFVRTRIMWASESFTDSQDSAMVFFTIDGKPAAFFFIYKDGKWQMFSETFQ